MEIEVFNKKQSVTQWVGIILLCVFPALLALPMLYSTTVIYLFLLFALITLKKDFYKQIPKQSIIFIGFFLISSSWYLKSSDISRASYLLERQLAFLIFPFILPLIAPISQNLIQKIFSIFSISLSIVVIYLLSIALIKLNNLADNSLNLSSELLYHNFFTAPIDIHPVYLSLYLALSVLYLISQIKYQSKGFKYLYAVLIIIHFVGVYFCASRNVVLTLIFILVFIYPFFIKKYLKRYILTMSILVSVFTLYSVNNSYLKQRFSRDLIGDVKSNQENAKLFPESRMTRWKVAFEIVQDKPIWGHGTGDEMVLLFKKYKEYKLWYSYLHEFNTHNQYLSILIKHGIVGLCLLLLMFLYFLYIAIRSRQFMYFAFLILILLVCVTENVLDANKGIFFIAFFNTMLGYLSLQINKSRISHRKILA